MNLKKLLIASTIALAATTTFATSKYSYISAMAGHTGYVAMQTNPGNYHELWTKKFGDIDHEAIFTHMAPAVDGVAYFSTVEHGIYNNDYYSSIFAIDTESGKKLWQYNTEDASFSYDSLHYANGKLFLNYETDKFAQVKVLEPKTGKLIYSVPVAGSLLPYADKNYLYTWRKQLLAIDQVDGKRQWQANAYTKHDVGGFAVDNDYVVVRYADKVLAYNRLTGKHEFDMEMPNTWWSNTLVRDLVIDDATNTIFTSFGEGGNRFIGTLYAIDLNQRAVRWKVPNQSGESQPVIVGNTVYNFTDRPEKLNAINKVTGKIEWTWAPPKDEGGIDYGVHAVATSDTIFIEGVKYTYAVSLKTHETVWKSERHGTMALDDGKLIIMNQGRDDDGKFSVTAIALK